MLAAAGPAAAAGKGWLTSVDEALAAAARSDRYILVDLYAEWCGWCKILERDVFSDPEFERYAHDFVLLHVDTGDGGEGSELQARHGATSLPTTLILDSDEVEIGRVTGFKPTGRFIAMIEQQIAAFEDQVKLFEKVRGGGDFEVQMQLAEDFHQRGDGRRAAALYEQVLRRVAAGEVHGSAAAWLAYQAADAYRLAGELGEAERHGDRSRAAARELGDRVLLERLDLLRFHLARDRGDCSEAVASLERFLAEYPQSSHQRLARRTLKSLQQGGGTACT